MNRVLNGAFNARPPKPRYQVTWDVAVVLQWIVSLGDNASMQLAALTHKMTMLLCLSQPLRSSDMAHLDLRFRQYRLEGVNFQPAAPLKILAKQDRPGIKA